MNILADVKVIEDLFAIEKSGISSHLKDIFECGELKGVGVVKIAIPTRYGAMLDRVQASLTNHYNWDHLAKNSRFMRYSTGRILVCPDLSR